MRVFEHFNEVGPPCPICKTKEDKQTVLVGIDGTEDGGNIEAKQVHLACLDLRLARRWKDDEDLIYQVFTKEASSEASSSHKS